MGDQLNGGSVDCPDIHSGVIQVMNTNDNDDDDNDTNDDDDGDDSPESYAPAYAITTPCFAVRQCSHCHHQSLVMMTMMVVTMIIMMTWQ